MTGGPLTGDGVLWGSSGDPGRVVAIADALARGGHIRPGEAFVIVLVSEDPEDGEFALADGLVAGMPQIGRHDPGGLPTPSDVAEAMRLMADRVEADHGRRPAPRRVVPGFVPPAFGGRPIGRDL